MSGRDEHQPPDGTSYRARPWRPSPEQVEQVRGWRKQQDIVLKERLRRLYGPAKP